MPYISTHDAVVTAEGHLVDSQILKAIVDRVIERGGAFEVLTDMNVAQDRYAEALADVDMVIVLSTMLHGIGVGNMPPGCPWSASTSIRRS